MGLASLAGALSRLATPGALCGLINCLTLRRGLAGLWVTLPGVVT